MQDENVACRDIGKVSFVPAVGCFGMSKHDRATRFRTFQFQHVSMHDTEGFVQYRISARRQVVTRSCYHNYPNHI